LCKLTSFGNSLGLTVLNTLKRHPAFNLAKLKLFAPFTIMQQVAKAAGYFLKHPHWELHTFDAAVGTAALANCVFTSKASLLGMDISPVQIAADAATAGGCDVAIDIGGEILYSGVGDPLVSWPLVGFHANCSTLWQPKNAVQPLVRGRRDAYRAQAALLAARWREPAEEKQQTRPSTRPFALVIQAGESVEKVREAVRALRPACYVALDMGGPSLHARGAH
jgi:hypothetical protein